MSLLVFWAKMSGSSEACGFALLDPFTGPPPLTYSFPNSASNMAFKESGWFGTPAAFKFDPAHLPICAVGITRIATETSDRYPGIPILLEASPRVETTWIQNPYTHGKKTKRTARATPPRSPMVVKIEWSSIGEWQLTITGESA